ncbi:MAG: hypothetical protein LBG19_11230 [Prevotellaceae bacterium]|jgi:hypothetical protein|nr:hypothetical protein [Prevotellaceae bacterium]
MKDLATDLLTEIGEGLNSYIGKPPTKIEEAEKNKIEMFGSLKIKGGNKIGITEKPTNGDNVMNNKEIIEKNKIERTEKLRKENSDKSKIERAEKPRNGDKEKSKNAKENVAPPVPKGEDNSTNQLSTKRGFAANQQNLSLLNRIFNNSWNINI